VSTACHPQADPLTEGDSPKTAQHSLENGVRFGSWLGRSRVRWLALGAGVLVVLGLAAFVLWLLPIQPIGDCASSNRGRQLEDELRIARAGRVMPSLINTTTALEFSTA
jgi:hypothetical protein